jgi:hypothetical protein
MFVAAPNNSLTGSQSVDLRKCMTPNFWIAKDDSETRTYTIPIITRITEKDATAVREENNKSTGFLLADLRKIIAPLKALEENIFNPFQEKRP